MNGGVLHFCEKMGVVKLFSWKIRGRLYPNLCAAAWIEQKNRYLLTHIVIPAWYSNNTFSFSNFHKGARGKKEEELFFNHKFMRKIYTKRWLGVALLTVASPIPTFQKRRIHYFHFFSTFPIVGFFRNTYPTLNICHLHS